MRIVVPSNPRVVVVRVKKIKGLHVKYLNIPRIRKLRELKNLKINPAQTPLNNF